MHTASCPPGLRAFTALTFVTRQTPLRIVAKSAQDESFGCDDDVNCSGGVKTNK